jgi:peptidoglycan/LPS O-acetylase OafA/YrhL
MAIRRLVEKECAQLYDDRMGFRTLSPGQSFACDSIRYAAALAVAGHHLADPAKITWYLDSGRRMVDLGHIGVVAFFVLSGFLIAYTVGRKSRSESYGLAEYMIERCVRIYLVFFPAIVLVVIVGALLATTNLNAEFPWQQFTPWHFFTNLAMLNGVRQIAQQGDTFALMKQSWTLPYEFFLYIIFGALMLPMGRTRAALIAKWVIVTIITLLLLQLTRSHLLVLGSAWIFGAGIAYCFQNRRLGYAAAALVLIAAVNYLVAPAYIAERVTIALLVIALFIVALAIFDKVPIALWARKLAAALAAFSYSLYLLHVMLLWTIFYSHSQTSAWMQNNLGSGGTFLVALVIINVAAFAFSLVTERHNNAVRRFIRESIAFALPGDPLTDRQTRQSK